MHAGRRRLLIFVTLIDLFGQSYQLLDFLTDRYGVKGYPLRDRELVRFGQDVLFLLRAAVMKEALRLYNVRQYGVADLNRLLRYLFRFVLSKCLPPLLFHGGLFLPRNECRRQLVVYDRMTTAVTAVQAY